MTLLYVLLVAHFVGDFICQSDWVAVNKSKDWSALTLHVTDYTFVVVVFVLLWLFFSGHETYPVRPLWLWLGVNGVAHFVQDAITSRITARLWFFERRSGEYRSYPNPTVSAVRNPWTLVEGRRHWFFVAIGADQLLHYVTLFVTASWWLR